MVSCSQQRVRRVVINAGVVWSSGALGLKDVSTTPLAVLQELLTAGTNKAMTARLHQLAAATAAGQGSDSISSRTTAVNGAAAAARLQLQEQYNMLLDLGEHELVSLLGWKEVGNMQAAQASQRASSAHDGLDSSAAAAGGCLLE